MKCTIPEISWHNREPVLSVHIQPVSEKFYRLATGGADCHVLIWQLMINENGSVKVEALSDLTRHQRAVNSVRWAPGGQYLATADDDANIIVWQLKTDNIPLLEGETNDKETWIVHKIMRGHKEDIYDLCWSPDSLKLLSGSIDNTAILWDFLKGKNEHILTDHKGFVQGVAWDPKGHYVATISTDRICRIFDNSGKQVKARIQKGYLPVPQEHFLHNKDVKYFHDDTFKSFFRRLDFSPDGTLLAVPSGHLEIEDCKKILNATLVFAVESWASPVAVLPSGRQCSTVARFCPILFELHEDGPEPTLSLPFRMILAIGTDHDIILYDTQQMAPFAYFKDIHYTRLTDLTWSHDGRLLVASSTDGFCALITFEPEELGTQYVKYESEAEESVLDVSGCEELEKDENVEASKIKKKNLLEQWAIKTPKRNKDETATSSTNTPSKSNNTETNDVIIIEDSPEIKKKRGLEADTVEVVPKRIKPILVMEDKKEKQKKKNTTCEIKKAKPIVDNKKTSEESATVKKRITPILVVEDKKVTEKNTPPPNIKKGSPRINPLLSFLKKTPSKEKLNKSDKPKNSATAPPPTIILDEVEARDAWKCEKEETKSTENKIISQDDCTEDFSLHLDDTNTESQMQNKTANEDNNDDGNTNNTKEETNGKVETEELPQTNDTNKTVASSNQAENSENCIKDVDKLTEPERDANLKNVPNIEDKPKRRIPLITLSSPKHKKK